MRIQHNIPAMNAYRNYNANTKALQGNLQKLSSGYKINKAGDDAAGLAISEKMRAQITGLEVAQKNAKDGISLVQTAEGATTEIHTMLNRMFSLAEQSANGTYDDEVDRAQLDNEFTKLKDEIDRIADATNFNGKKLLDGTLDGGGSKKSGSVGAITTSLEPTTVEATKGSYETTAAVTAPTGLNTNSTTMTFAFSDGNGNDTVVEFTLTSGAHSTSTAAADAGKGIYANGEWIADVGNANAIQATEMSKVLTAAFDKVAPDLKDNLKMTVDNAGKIKFEAKEAGAGTMALKSLTTKSGTTNTVVALTTKEGADAFEAVNLSDTVANKKWDGTAASLEKSIFEVGGEKFVIYNNGLTLTDEMNALLAEAGVGNNAIEAQAQAQDTIANTVKAINQATGLAVEQGAVDANGAWTAVAAGGTPAATDTYIALKANDSAPTGNKEAGGGLRLRVGDSTNSYDDITVSVKSMKADKLADLTEGTGKVLKDLSVDKPENADTAMEALKGMINYVSNERGKLGATQNRLDHTINNLSTMQENIQDAEATIRDVDVAEEMMKYTKNNILVQSAQAMLAQANQLPQGVLQLLG